MKLFVVLSLLFTGIFAIEVSDNVFIRGNNLFGASVYNELAKSATEENLLFSPLSAELVLCLAQSGAQNGTAEEMGSVLHLPNSNKQIENEIKKLLATLKPNPKYTLYLANKIYIEENFEINKDFKETAIDTYYSDVENVEFSKMEEAAKIINEWVEKQTENKIHNLIDSKTLNEQTRAILINALYFKAQWAHSFLKYNTVKRNFYKTPQNMIQVDAMQLDTEYFDYYESSKLNARFLQMLFKDRNVTFTIVLPNKIQGLTALESQIEGIFDLRPYKKTLVHLVLPKFRIDKSIDFINILKSLGMKKPFSFEDADFSGIAGKKGDLIINEIKQKAFIDVNEKGVEAAAATDVGFVVGAAPPLPGPVTDFIVDHPFIFYLKVKDVVLFAGRVSEPKY